MLCLLFLLGGGRGEWRGLNNWIGVWVHEKNEGSTNFKESFKEYSTTVLFGCQQ